MIRYDSIIYDNSSFSQMLYNSLVGSNVNVDSRLRLTGGIQKIEDYGANGLEITWHCVVEIEACDKPACVAEFISLMFE